MRIRTYAVDILTYTSQITWQRHGKRIAFVLLNTRGFPEASTEARTGFSHNPPRTQALSFRNVLPLMLLIQYTLHMYKLCFSVKVMTLPFVKKKS